VHAGKWPVRYDTDDISRIYFQDPADNSWHPLMWEHASEVGVPFSAETLSYARRLAISGGARHVDDRLALADLLERWDAGLTRHPAERRMAIRASQQRQARLDSAAGGPDATAIAALPAVRAVMQPPDVHERPPAADAAVSDDDTDAELDVFADDEPAYLDDAEFYADALEVLR
jgi:hypothetical protein